MRRFFYDTEFIEFPGFLELLSIGVVSEDGTREFYAEVLGAPVARANSWVRANVLPHLCNPGVRLLVKRDVAENLRTFLAPTEDNPVELWAYYGAYDHVALCWLFGPMSALPPGMPMLTMDIKQMALSLGDPELPPSGNDEHNALVDARWVRSAYLFLRFGIVS